MKMAATILGCIIPLAIIIGGIMKYDAKVVKAEDIRPIQQSIEKLNQRIDKSDLEAMGRDTQRRMWMLEDKHGFDAVQGFYEYRCLKRDLKATEDKLKILGSGE